jgi:hypothetical protein
MNSEQGIAYSISHIATHQVRRRSLFVVVVDLFNAAWCAWTPQPRGTQLRLRCSVVRGRPPSGTASTAFERQRQSRLAPLCVSCPLPDSVWPLLWLSQSRILAAVLGPCEFWCQDLYSNIPVGISPARSKFRPCRFRRQRRVLRVGLRCTPPSSNAQMLRRTA